MAGTSKLQKPPVNDPALVPVGEHAGAPILPLDRVAVVVGADANCRLHLTSAQISRHHTLIVTTPEEIYLRDLCSRTQTFVNEEAVREAVLHHGDYLRVGRFRFQLSDPRTRTAKAARPGPIELRVDGELVPVAPDSRTIVIGHRDECDVKLDDEAVSTIHAVIFAVGEKWLVRDLHSRGGTRLNDEKIHQDELPDSAVLTIGDSTIAILPVAAAAPMAAAEDAVPPIPLPATDKEVPPAMPQAIPVQPVAAPALEVIALFGHPENAAAVLPAAQPVELDATMIAPPVPLVDEPLVAWVALPSSPVMPAPLAPPVVEPLPVPLATKSPDVDSLDDALEAIAPPAAAELESPAPVTWGQAAELMAPVTEQVAPEIAVELPAPSAVEESIAPLVAPPVVIADRTAIASGEVVPLPSAPAVEPAPPAATVEALNPLPPDILRGISFMPQTVVINSTFTLDEDSSAPDGPPSEPLSPVAPPAEEPLGHDDAVATMARMDLGSTAEETLLVVMDPLAAPLEPEPTLPPGEISGSAPPEPPAPSPAAPVTSAPSPVPFLLPVIGRPAQWSDSFSLDDGFFGADLDTAGVIVQPHGQALPASTPISRITTTPAERSGAAEEEKPAESPPTPAIPASLPLGVNMDFGIGGMGLTLPELAPPPEDFGKVSVSFGDRNLPPRPGAPATKPAEAPVDESLPDIPAEKLRAGAAAKFAAVPKSISTRAGSGAFSEDEASGQDAVVIPPSATDGTRADRAALPTGIIGGIAGVAVEVRQKDAFSDVEPTALNDAAFGGQRLSKSDDYVIPETAAGKAAVSGEEIKDFSDDPFWDARDEDGSEPPPRILLPQAPPEPSQEVANLDNPLAGEAGLTGQGRMANEPVLPEIPETPEKTKEVRPQRANVPLRLDLSPLRRPPPVEAFQPRGPHGEPIVLRPRHKKLRIPLLLLAMLVAVAMALLIIYYTVAVKSKVTGNLQFNHVDLVPGSSQWEKWQADERALIEQPATLDIAQRTFKELTTGANPGFLADYRVTNLARGGQFIPASAPDKPTVLSLVYDSSDLTWDQTRMIALLRAIAQANAPLTYASHRRATDLKATDEEINVYHQQQSELKTAQTSQAAILAGGATPERLASLEQAMETQLAAGAAADAAVARDNEHLNRLLTTVPGEIPTTAPSGDFAVADTQLSQWLTQLKDWQEALTVAQAAGAQKDSDTRQRVKDALDRFHQDLLSVAGGSAELAKSVAPTQQLLATVQDLTVALITDGDHLAKDTRDLQRLLGLVTSDPQLVAASRELIDNEHKQIAGRRKNIDDALAPLQDQVTKLAAAGTLPAPQQNVIRQLQERLEAYRQARQRFDAITDSTGEETEKVKALRQQVQELTAQIDQRQRAVVAATQKRLSDQQHAALANQIEAARDVLSRDQGAAVSAQAAYQIALESYFRVRINQANAQQATARLAGLKLQADQIQQKLDALQTKRLQITSAVGPIYDVKPVDDRDVDVVSVDNRQAYSLLATISIAMIFATILAVVHRRNRNYAQLALTQPQAAQPPANAMK